MTLSSTPQDEFPISGLLRILVDTVVGQTEVIDQLFVREEAKGVLQLQELNRQIVFRLQALLHDRSLEVEGQPLLNSAHFRAACQVHEQSQVENERRCQDSS